MRITHLRSDSAGGLKRVSAKVTWEDCDRPARDVFFEVRDELAEGLICNPDAFLVGAILPAFRGGESRIWVEAEVSPELLDGLPTVMNWLRLWFRPDKPLVRIETRTASKGVVARPPDRAGFFFSGGVDSLATLTGNRRLFPRQHPGSIKDGIIVFGLEVEQREAFALAETAVAEMAAESGVTLLPISTNVRLLDDDWVFWRDEFQGAALAAVGHAFAGRLTHLSIAATYDAANMGPWGSHPVIDPNFSTHTLRVHHDGVALSRLEKVKLLLDWPTALRRIRVCNRTEFYKAGMLNCGECEKCVRTMLELIALGALETSGAFPATDVTERAASIVDIHDGYVASCYRELLEPLAKRGRTDLVRGLKVAFARYEGERGWRASLKRLDQRHLNGSLGTIKRALSGAIRSSQ